MPRRAAWTVIIVALGASGACARSAAPPVAPVPVVYATPTVITPQDDEPPALKFARARAFLLDGRAAQAAQLFDELAHAGDGAAGDEDEIVSLSRFNAGVAWEQGGDRERALERFLAVVARSPAGDVGKWGALRAARLHAYLEGWSQLSAVADLLLLRTDLSDVERLEAYGAKALAVVESGDPDGAERFIAKGRDIIDELRLGEGGKLPLEVAQIHFALGEARKLRSEAIVFVPLPANFAEVLEQRCQGLLDAQSAYSDAMRSYDAHWAAMSGYRVGQLYQQLHHDVLAITVPKAANTTEKKRLFEGAMSLRYRVLLEKGLKMMEHTLMIGDRTGEASSWIDRAREAKGAIEKSLSEQKEQMAQLPYSEKELEKALQDLASQPRVSQANARSKTAP